MGATNRDVTACDLCEHNARFANAICRARDVMYDTFVVCYDVYKDNTRYKHNAVLVPFSYRSPLRSQTVFKRLVNLRDARNRLQNRHAIQTDIVVVAVEVGQTIVQIRWHEFFYVSSILAMIKPKDLKESRFGKNETIHPDGALR